ncbi:hypothetical protein D9758_010051 [Tetrapyrgos nigripes]|uniref:Protein SMG7 n=1 Tax=Tetrapyrgos nigripes TaxID=182062 RepID=A0A8H5FT28_9AGAR|nr:hypothetical protein D9758_010051 [Tetrapyrgos nigripes]
MSNQSASDIAREAKEKHAALKELLKTKEPFDKEIDFPRKDLRRRYLSLLFVHPYAKESKDAETHLWMQTSYAFISEYKQRITHLDRIIQRQTQQQPQQNQSRHGPHGPVEYRKLLQRFRQFLADEEKFWTQFVLRFQQAFALEEAKPVLATLGIVSDDVEFAPDAEAPRHPRNNYQFPSSDHSASLVPSTVEQRETRIAILGKALICLGDIARYRELYNESGGRPRAGHEDAPASGGRRPRNKRGGFDQPRPRNYDKARQCYEQAKYLVPHEGNPSHQLAILSNYSKDTFSAILHYYRALCLRQSYDTALENLNTTLQKFLEIQVKKNKEGVTVPPDIANVPKVRIELFKEKLMVLHALWRLGRKKNDASTLNQADKLFADFYALIAERHLTEELIVQIIVVAQGALWTHRMLRQTSGHRGKSNGEQVISSPASHTLSSKVIESRIFTHLLSLYRALLEVGIEALRDPPPIDAGNGEDSDLAQKIAVELRRILPALRIASKWLRANFLYCMSDPELAGTDSGSDGTDEKSTPPSISPASACTIEFWKQYAEFLRALSRTFPMNHLPTSVFPLKEDIEMRGFLPLKATLDERFADSGNGASETDDAPHEESEVHPNVVQLMRIKDLLSDGAAIVGLENSPLALYGNQFVLKGVEAEVHPIPMDSHTVNGSNGHTRVHSSSRSKTSKSSKKGEQRLQSPSFSRSDPVAAPTIVEDEDIIAITSKNDDDVVREAFEHLDHSDEEDEIVWNPRASPVTSPVLPSPIAPPRPSVPNVASRSPVNPAIMPINSQVAPLSVSPARAIVPSPNKSPLTVPNAAVRVAPTTAKDLLIGFMSLNTSRASGGAEFPQNLRKTSDPLPPLAVPTPANNTFLFGERPGNSIWSASQDELRFPSGTTGSVSQHSFGHHHNVSSQDLTHSPSIWGSYPTSTQLSQQHMPGSLPSTSFAAPPVAISTDAFSGSAQHHHRVPSASVAAQLFPSRNAQNAAGFPGPFGYASPVPTLEPTLPSEPQNLYHTGYTDVSMQQPVHENYYNSGIPITKSPSQGLHSPYVLPETRVNQPFMSSAWGRVG